MQVPEGDPILMTDPVIDRVLRLGEIEHAIAPEQPAVWEPHEGRVRSRARLMVIGQSEEKRAQVHSPSPQCGVQFNAREAVNNGLTRPLHWTFWCGSVVGMGMRYVL